MHVDFEEMDHTASLFLDKAESLICRLRADLIRGLPIRVLLILVRPANVLLSLAGQYPAKSPNGRRDWYYSTGAKESLSRKHWLRPS